MTVTVRKMGEEMRWNGMSNLKVRRRVKNGSQGGRGKTTDCSKKLRL